MGFSEVFKCDKDSRLNIPGYHDLITRTRHDSNRGGVGMFMFFGMFIKDNSIY